MRRLLVAAIIYCAFIIPSSAQLVTAGPPVGTTALCQSAVAVPHTGNITETILATCSLASNIIGLNGRLHVSYAATHTNSANTKTIRVRLGGIGGTIYSEVAGTTEGTTYDVLQIANRNNAASQVGWSIFTVVAPITSTINTAAATTLVITGQLAVGGETVTLQDYAVELIR